MVAVFYESWQMQCCGEPFAVGDVVRWSTVPAGVSSAEWARPFGGIDCFEDHHGDASDILEGTVTGIRAVWFDNTRGDGTRWQPIDGSETTAKVDTADGWEQEDSPRRIFDGYLVTIRERSG